MGFYAYVEVYGIAGKVMIMPPPIRCLGDLTDQWVDFVLIMLGNNRKHNFPFLDCGQRAGF